jgi:glycosyltransferase involved in cell wall biosynthesis
MVVSMTKRSTTPKCPTDKLRKTRIMFVLKSLKVGGAERVAATIIEHLDKSKFEVCLVLLEDTREIQIHEEIQVIQLHKKGRLKFLKFPWALARLASTWKPDVVLSSWIYTNIVTVLTRAVSKDAFKLILIEHDVPSVFVANRKRFGERLFYKWLPRWLYRLADNIVCVSKGAAKDYQAFYRLSKDKIRVIYNPIDLHEISILSQCQVEHPWFIDKYLPVIVCVGRLSPEKGFDYLLRAFAELIHKVPCRLVIIGQGIEELSLKALTHSMQLDNAVDFVGLQSNPFKFIARSDLLVVSSIYESFGMVIIEAMSCGIPVVSTDCTGPSEIISSGVNGILVPCQNATALVVALETILTNKEYSAKIALQGRNYSEEFNVNHIITQYECLLRRGM